MKMRALVHIYFYTRSNSNVRKIQPHVDRQLKWLSSTAVQFFFGVSEEYEYFTRLSYLGYHNSFLSSSSLPSINNLWCDNNGSFPVIGYDL